MGGFQNFGLSFALPLNPQMGKSAYTEILKYTLTFRQISHSIFSQMEDAILIQTLSVFTSDEMDAFGQFIEGPFLNCSSNARQNNSLFYFLKEKIINRQPIERADMLNAISTQEQLNPDSHYLENRMSDLMAFARKFVLWQEMQAQQGAVQEHLAMARFYRERQVAKREEQAIRKAQNVLNKISPKNKERPLLAYWVEQELTDFESNNNQRKGDLNTPSTIQSLSVFYGVHLLEIAAVTWQQERVVPGFRSEWKGLIEGVRVLFREQNYLGNVSIELLDKALFLLENEIADPHQALHDFLKKMSDNIGEIPDAIALNLAAYARIFCTVYIARGHSSLRPVRLSLYKDHLEKGWLLDNGKLIPSIFINMVNAGLNFGDKVWVKWLLDTHSDKVSGEDHERIANYGFAQYYFHTGQIKEAREYMTKLFQASKFKDSSIEKLVRILEIKILYEDGELLLDTQLHNFLMFLRRSERKLEKSKRQLHLNFVAVLKKMISLSEKITTKNIGEVQKNKILENINGQLNDPGFPVAERLWLLQKIKLL